MNEACYKINCVNCSKYCMSNQKIEAKDIIKNELCKGAEKIIITCKFLQEVVKKNNTFEGVKVIIDLK